VSIATLKAWSQHYQTKAETILNLFLYYINQKVHFLKTEINKPLQN